jgi:ADP-ribose pyrophosphatase
MLIEAYNVLDFPTATVGVLPIGEDGRFLMIEQYRFIVDQTAWSIPAGGAEPGEDIEAAALRELVEETGYRAAQITRLGTYHPAIGDSNQIMHLFVARGLVKEREPADINEVLRVAWFEPDDIWTMVDSNQIRDGLALTTLLWHFARSRR